MRNHPCKLISKNAAKHGTGTQCISRIGLALLVGLSLSLCACLPIEPRRDKGKEVYTPPTTSGNSARDKNFLNIPASKIRSLHINCGPGSLTVEGVQGQETMDIECDVYAKAENLIEAKRINKETSIHLSAQDSESPNLVINPPHLSSGQQSYIVNIRIKVPPRVRIFIEDGAGDISVSGLASGVEIKNSAGKIDVYDVHGGAKINNKGGDIEVSSAKGQIQIVDSLASLKLSEIEGDLDIQDPGGKLVIQHIEGKVVARDNPDGATLINIVGSALLIGIPASKCKLDNPGALSFQAK